MPHENFHRRRDAKHAHDTAMSSQLRQLAMEKVENFAEEVAFYHEVNRIFDKQSAECLLMNPMTEPMTESSVAPTSSQIAGE